MNNNLNISKHNVLSNSSLPWRTQCFRIPILEYSPGSSTAVLSLPILWYLGHRRQWGLPLHVDPLSSSILAQAYPCAHENGFISQRGNLTELSKLLLIAHLLVTFWPMPASCGRNPGVDKEGTILAWLCEELCGFTLLWIWWKPQTSKIPNHLKPLEIVLRITSKWRNTSLKHLFRFSKKGGSLWYLSRSLPLLLQILRWRFCSRLVLPRT